MTPEINQPQPPDPLASREASDDRSDHAGHEAVPYESNEQHLWDELRRIDHLVRAQTLRWRLTVGASKPQHLWGMIHVTDAEVDAFLSSDFVPPGKLPRELENVLQDSWRAASRLDAEIRRRVEQTARGTLRLEQLKSVCGLSDLERDIILVCLLAELDGRYRRLFGYLQDDVSRTAPAVELILEILHPHYENLVVGRSAFHYKSTLRKQHLLHIVDDDSLSVQTVRLDRRIVDYLLECNRTDARIAACAPTAAESWNELPFEPEFLSRLQTFAGWWVSRHGRADAGATLFLHGREGVGRLVAARAICEASGTSMLVVDASQTARAGVPFEELVDLTYREAKLQGSALYWTKCEVLLAENQSPHSWEYLVSSSNDFPGLVFLASSVHWEPAGQFQRRFYQRIVFPQPAYELRRRLWNLHLPSGPEMADPDLDRAALAEQLANGFQLTPGQIIDVVRTARELAFQSDPETCRVSVDDLHEACRLQSSRRLITFARRIEPRTDLNFSDLVLPEPNRVQLMELRARIRHRSRLYTGFGFERRLSLGKGLIALFTGSSGTGKTMGAELLAREQGVDLYKVDLSAVVSKYVGETEKNLSRVFAEAEDANAIIFFDEADALFGKRGEVKEAQDRWANMEVNYLLQRVEEYAGVVILASNLRQNIDDAFLRRIHVIVEFPFPEACARFRILQGLFPPSLGHPDESELQLLSDRFKLAGGRLKNVVLDAAFRALSENGRHDPMVTLRHLVSGAAREYQKLGRPITKSEFGEDFFHWVEKDIL